MERKIFGIEDLNACLCVDLTLIGKTLGPLSNLDRFKHANVVKHVSNQERTKKKPKKV